MKACGTWFASPPFKQRGVRLEFNRQDVWIGVYWARKPWPILSSWGTGWTRHVYICLLPCLPLHLWWTCK